MRKQDFLEELLYDLWENHFCDVPRKNLVLIKFGKRSKYQLGSIKLAHGNTRIKSILNRKLKELSVQDEKSVTVITVTGYFRNDLIPANVVRSTIAHELCHYTHGFSSPLERRFKNPHQGNIIKKELSRRDLLKEYKESELWIKENWKSVIKEIEEG